jgi:hypothetical protein
MTGSQQPRMLCGSGSVTQKRGTDTLVSFAPNPDPAKPTANGTHASPKSAQHDPKYILGLRTQARAYADLAGWLLAKETGEVDPPELAAAAEQVCQKLSRRLSRWVSADGSRAIVSRAVHMARVEFRFLDGVSVGIPPEACLVGLHESIRDVEAGKAGAAVLAVLSAMLDLLVGFLGEELTLGLVQDIWPDVPLRQPDRSATSNGQAAGR